MHLSGVHDNIENVDDAGRLRLSTAVWCWIFTETGMTTGTVNADREPIIRVSFALNAGKI